MKKLRVFTAFSGYDSQCMALDRIGIDYELVGWSEIDRFAIQAHNAVYPQWADRNYGDISKVDWNTVPDFDLFTYSFPCTDISQAGQQKGLAEGSGTRSSLLWECKKAIDAKRPQYLLMENVKALVSKKFLSFFSEWGGYLERIGYANFSKVLNAKDFNVPQNRERIFMVSILRSDDNPYPTYHFPKEVPSDRRLKDVLEEKVDEKYYLSEKAIQSFIRTNDCTPHNHNFAPKNVMGEVKTILPLQSEQDRESELTITSSTYPEVRMLGRVSNSQDGIVVSIDGIAPCHTSGHGNCPKIALNNG